VGWENELCVEKEKSWDRVLLPKGNPKPLSASGSVSELEATGQRRNVIRSQMTLDFFGCLCMSAKVVNNNSQKSRRAVEIIRCKCFAFEC